MAATIDKIIFVDSTSYVLGPGKATGRNTMLWSCRNVVSSRKEHNAAVRQTVRYFLSDACSLNNPIKQPIICTDPVSPAVIS